MNVTVREIMKKEVITLFEADTLRHAFEIMSKKNIRHLPVISDKRKVIGMLSHRDILPFLSKQYSESGYELSADGIDEFVLRKVMTKEVICLDQCTPLRDALEIFVSRKIGCIPILNDLEELIGIVTPIDVLRVLKNVLPAKANTKS